MNKFYKIAAIGLTFLILIACFLWFSLTRVKPVPTVTPTLPVSATPSDTPIPPTLSPTPRPTQTATATVDTPPSLTVTATATPTAVETAVPATYTPTGTAVPSPTSTTHEVERGDTYWHIADYWYGEYVCWQTLKRANGWPERALPIGTVLVIPDDCTEIGNK